MKVCKVSDYETAFDFLVAWLSESRGVVQENMPDPDDEVDFAKADGYLTRRLCLRKTCGIRL